jgi:hypothetical protein
MSVFREFNGFHDFIYLELEISSFGEQLGILPVALFPGRIIRICNPTNIYVIFNQDLIDPVMVYDVDLLFFLDYGIAELEVPDLFVSLHG